MSANWRGLPAGNRRLLVLALVVLLLAAGFALRLPTLGTQSLDNDEIFTLRAIAEPTLEGLLNAEALTGHPPLYFLLLPGWAALAGTSEFAIRFVSVAAGMLTLAVVGAILRRGGWSYGVLALGLGAVSPLLVYFAQEARMYALSALAVACLLASVQQLTGAPGAPRPVPRWRDWIVFGVAAAFCIYAALLAVLPVVAAGLVLGLLFLRQPKQLAGLALATLVAALLFLPWALYKPLLADAVTGTTVTASWLDALRQAVAAMVVGQTWLNPLGSALAIMALLLLLPTLVLRQWEAPLRWMLPAMLGLVVVLVVVLAAGGFEFAARHLAPAAPIAVAWFAIAIGSAWRAWRPLALLGVPVLVVMVIATGRYYLDPFQQRPDFRGVASYLELRIGPRDRVLFNAPWASDPYGYYLRDLGPVEELEGGRLPAIVADDPAGMEAVVLAALEEPGRLWHVTWQNWVSDPQGRVEALLDRTAPRLGGIRLPYATATGYVAGPLVLDELPRTTQARPQARIGDVAVLAGAEVQAAGAEPGGAVEVTLYWEPRVTTQRPLTVFVQGLDAEGRVRFQSDRQPAGGFVPTTRWPRDQVVRDVHDLAIGPGVPQGTYRLIAGLYDAETGERLRLPNGDDFVALGNLGVGSP